MSQSSTATTLPREVIPAAVGSRRRSLSVGIAVSAVVFTTMCIRNTYVFTSHMFYDSDFAANAILIDRAKHFGLDIGNYSRVGFNHPGPAFLYPQAWAELLFHDLLHAVPEPFNAHQLGMMIVNAALIGAAAYLLHRHTKSVFASALSVGIVILAAGSMDATLVQPWMPFLYIWPFFLFLVAAASVMSGRTRSLPLFILGGGMLVHGHVSFAVPVALIGIAGIATEVVRHRHELGSYAKRERTPLVISAALVGLFLLPIVVNLLRHWPGELAKYYDYSQQVQRHDLKESLRFVASYWPGSGAVAVLIGAGALLAGLVLAWRHPLASVRRFCLAIEVVAALATLAFLEYAIAGVDFFVYRYVGYFYLAVPAMVLCVPVIAIATWPSISSRPVGTAALTIGLVLVGLWARGAPGFYSGYLGSQDLPIITSEIRTDPQRGGRSVALDFPHQQWPMAVAVVEYGRHHGLDACVTDPSLTFLFTSEFVCTPDEDAKNWRLRLDDPTAAPTGRVIYRDGVVVVTSV